MSKIDYDLNHIRGVVFDVDGVLSPSTVSVDSDGCPVRMTNMKDAYAIQLAIRQGLRVCIITGADSTPIIKHYNALGVKEIFTKVGEKLPVLNSWMKTNSFSPFEVAYVGDDIPDLPCMKAVGLPVAPCDADVVVKDCARYVSRKQGGYGVARDLLEEILKVRNLWLASDIAFGW